MADCVEKRFIVRNHAPVTLATFLTIIAGMPLGLLGQNLSIGAIRGVSVTDADQTETAYNIRTWSPSNRLDCRRNVRTSLPFALLGRSGRHVS
jgi:hypothetical protein